MDETQVLVDDDEMNVVDPLDPGAQRIHDLLIQELFPQEDLLRAGLQGPEELFRSRVEANGLGIAAVDVRPIHFQDLFSMAGLDGQGGHPGKKLAHLDLEIGQRLSQVQQRL